MTTGGWLNAPLKDATERLEEHWTNHCGKTRSCGNSEVGELRRVGPAAAYRLVKAANPGQTIPVCYYLYSLQGALDGVHWDDLPEKKKRQLLGQVQ